MKLYKVLKLNHSIKSLIDRQDIKLNTSFKFRLLGIMKSIEPYLENFEIIRNEKIKEYGTVDEDNKITIDENDTEARNKFSKDMENLLHTNVNLHIKKIKSKDAFNAGVPADYLVRIYDILKK